jgi:hypothetical protein
MRLAGRFSRRLHAYAKANGIAVVNCAAGERKHELAEQYLAKTKITQGLFLILVGRAQAPVWDISAKHHIEPKKPMPYVNHYSFHILDSEWGHIEAVIALGESPSGQGFTASELARQVRLLSNQAESDYGPRRAAYDLKKLRAKNIVRRISQRRRYQSTSDALRALVALVVLRNKAIKPLLAAAQRLHKSRGPQNPRAIDKHYEIIRTAMEGVFNELGLAA